MSIFSWIFPSSLYWPLEIASVVLETAVAIGVFAEGITLFVPERFLPPALRTSEAIDRLKYWSSLTLVVALVLIVPVDFAKESIGRAETEGNANSIASERRATLPRTLTEEQQSNLAEAMSRWSIVYSNSIGMTLNRIFYVIPSKSSYEIDSLANQIRAALNRAGWTESKDKAYTGKSFTGIALYPNNNVNGLVISAEIVKILNKFNIKAEMRTPDLSKPCNTNTGGRQPETELSCSEIVLVVGEHP